ncbi:MAG TPA: DNA alkylation repair protein [Patescibacteria group bacterium]|nr:DNA alkylation repair protein [Patescibacteria group bacterium]
MTYFEILKKLKSSGSKKAIEGMARFGIRPKTKVYGVSMADLRIMAKRIEKSHALALRLWNSGVHEAQILASIVDKIEKVTEKQMEQWMKDFDSWDVCDQVCMNLFWRAPFSHRKATEWSGRKNEFEKRAGFALMAVLAWKDKNSSDAKFKKFFPLIKKESIDERNFVRKSVNWALRQIGKRNAKLKELAIKTAKEILKINSKSARWIASDAIKELESAAVQKRLA